MTQEPTQSETYANDLIRVVERRWKQRLRFIDPHRQNVRAVCRGRSVLEIGCGAGRNLHYLDRPDCFGTDHNREAVRFCRLKGLKVAQTIKELELPADSKFGVLLFSHVIEHLSFDDAVSLVSEHLDLLEESGRVVIMTPQLKGQQRDMTHVTYFGKVELDELARRNGLIRKRLYSFPFPRLFGRFIYFNENVFVGVIASPRSGDRPR